MRPDPDIVAAVLAEIAGREIAPRFGRLQRDDIRTKSSPTDLVTEVDLAAEAALQEAFRSLCPEADFVGEERAAADPGCMDALAGKGRCWIVDPLDGTRNFVNGVAEFGTIVAFVEDGETVMGWIYAVPNRTCAVVERGGGVHFVGEGLRGAGDRPAIASQGQALRGLRSIGWLTPEWKTRIVSNLKTRFASTSAHCSAYAYLALLQGEADFVINSRVQPWDHAAGALFLEETGGRAAFLDDDQRYLPRASVDRPMLAAASADRWSQISETLRAQAE